MEQALLQQLLEQGNQLLVRDIGDAGWTDDLAAYIANFSAWIEKLGGTIPRPSSPAEIERLQALSETHQNLLKKAELAKAISAKDLGQFRVKGKAIMAYTDTLPKRVSLSSDKKG